ncbi:MAG: sulfate adenylyltransferase [Nitrososphaerales archaeon]|jgi:sulfate adenylyltransferase|nr:sulfate adenylyltransferase [Nitrososphaerales archaeon]
MINPHGGQLVNRVLKGGAKEKVLDEKTELFEIEVNQQREKEIENIATGVYSPLEGFLVQNDLDNVVNSKRLSNDLAWTIPIILDINNEEANKISIGDTVRLSSDGHFIASMEVEDKYKFNKKELAEKVYGTVDTRHPGVAGAFKLEDILLGGKINLVDSSESSYPKYHLSPAETRKSFEDRGWKTIVGFQTRNVPHVGHEYVQKTALTFVDGLFINPVIGRKKSGDFKDDVILETYRVLIDNYYLKERAMLAILQTEMRYAGPREAIFHAIIRKNFGCTHFILGRDHAGVGNFYPPYAAQEIFEKFPDLGISPLFFPSFFYCRTCGSSANDKTCPHAPTQNLECPDPEVRVEFSGTKLRDILIKGERPPPEMIRPEVTDVILKWENPFV